MSRCLYSVYIVNLFLTFFLDLIKSFSLFHYSCKKGYVHIDLLQGYSSGLLIVCWFQSSKTIYYLACNCLGSLHENIMKQTFTVHVLSYAMYYKMKNGLLLTYFFLKRKNKILVFFKKCFLRRISYLNSAFPMLMSVFHITKSANINHYLTTTQTLLFFAIHIWNFKIKTAVDNWHSTNLK